MYAALCTRPAIPFAVTHLAQFTSFYGPSPIIYLKQIIRYFKGSSFLGITYNALNPDKLGEVGYSDSGWGPNLIDRKSYTGSVFAFGEAPVSWGTMKQPTVALPIM